MVQPIEWDMLEHTDDLDPRTLNLAYDPGNKYSVPYYVGSVGILYDTTVVDEEDLEDGWELLRNEKYKGNVYMYDSERDSFMVALKALGYSMNTTNKDEINAAYDWLIEQRKNMDVVYVGDDVMDNMIGGNKAMAVVYSGDAVYVIAENEDMDYFEPQQGTNLWCDGMVLTNECEDTDLAYNFMNFMMEYDNACANTVFIGYTSPLMSVSEEMMATEYEGIGAYSPGYDGEKNEVFRYQEQDIKSYFADLWTKVKSY
jgi:spermidine/putrescine transport system permease protein